MVLLRVPLLGSILYGSYSGSRSFHKCSGRVLAIPVRIARVQQATETNLVGLRALGGSSELMGRVRQEC